MKDLAFFPKLFQWIFYALAVVSNSIVFLKLVSCFMFDLDLTLLMFFFENLKLTSWNLFVLKIISSS